MYTENDREQVIELLNNNETPIDIASKFNMSLSTVNRIKKKLTPNKLNTAVYEWSAEEEAILQNIITIGRYTLVEALSAVINYNKNNNTLIERSLGEVKDKIKQLTDKSYTPINKVEEQRTVRTEEKTNVKVKSSNDPIILSKQLIELYKERGLTCTININN